jgi:GNAT superfamily N-acetyltransferase
MLREAIVSDIPGIQRVRHSVRENRLVSIVISDEMVREAIQVSGRGWVVESEREIVAFGIGNALNGNVWALFVHPDHERRGHGRRLHDTILSWLWSRGLDRLWLTTEPGTRAQGFYEAAGWRLADRTKHGELLFEMYRNHDRPSR